MSLKRKGTRSRNRAPCAGAARPANPLCSEPPQKLSNAALARGDPASDPATYFTAQDSHNLKDAVERGVDFYSIARSLKFSHKSPPPRFLTGRFPISALVDHWFSLLTDEPFAKARIPGLNKVCPQGKRAKWTDEEEQLLHQLVESGINNFATILARYRSKFHPTRTAKSLEAHYYKMRRTIAQKSRTHKAVSLPPLSKANPFEVAHQVALEQELSFAPEKKAHTGRFANFFESFPEAYACLAGQAITLPLNKLRVNVGRNEKSAPVAIDVDLLKAGYAARNSRHQAVIEFVPAESGAPAPPGGRLPAGHWQINVVGKNPTVVNGAAVATGDTAKLPRGSLVDLGGLLFIFEVHDTVPDASSSEDEEQPKLRFIGDTPEEMMSDGLSDDEREDDELDVEVAPKVEE